MKSPIELDRRSQADIEPITLMEARMLNKLIHNYGTSWKGRILSNVGKRKRKREEEDNHASSCV